MLDQLEDIEPRKRKALGFLASLSGIDLEFRYRGRHENHKADLMVSVGKGPYMSDEYIWQRDISHREAEDAVAEIIEDIDIEFNEEITDFDISY